uniref:HSF-type DNA-binding domain-containing protein n=1 Tax=Anolis carolinensis TaxID=28377 RepID=H9G7R0_ANOCA|nr:PREDICTED: heat shock factor protein 3 isoform X1 [Anolis carolinensis]|eukprot:XP_008118581.1 PREDICTED: heat shock factor protein 3 isoform X1 [Anolis carolinensis]
MAAGPGASPVPGFLAKLWALVEDSGSDDVISWSKNGQNFCILDEQRFAKELLPKYFKHNNLSSFIRQLNIYGFRKVIALENGMMASDKSCAIEFQHPYFKRGKANLLPNIKRKVSAVRAEDLKVPPDELQKALSEVQGMREQQIHMDLKLASMKRENKALWKEVVSLRQKHSQQQQLLSKILEFILGLMRGNCILGLKRKRPLTDASGASPSKFSRSYVRIPVENHETAAISDHNPSCEDSIVIRDITDAQDEEEDEEEGEGSGAGTENLLALAHTTNGNGEAPASPRESIPAPAWEASPSSGPVQLLDVPFKAGAVELHQGQAASGGEDPASVIDSILNENQAVAQNDALLDREEIQDFLNCIDASLEELQAMLSGKKLSYAPDAVADAISPELPVWDMNLTEVPAGLEDAEDLPGSLGMAGMDELEPPGKNDMQLIQYMGNPLLSLLEDHPPSEAPGGQRTLWRPGRGGDPHPRAGLAAEPPLVPEDGSGGEYRLFPLLFPSPPAPGFIDETPEPDAT